MRLTFIGGAQTVTGSCILVETNAKKFLVDCGLPQGYDEKKIGLKLPFKGSEIDYVFLTHAHIDHSGRLPLLVKEGFKGKIFATNATCDLCSIMLVDSGHIQEMESEWLSRKNIRAGKEAVEPLYSIEDAKKSLQFFQGYPYNQKIAVTDGIEIEFTDAGHLLGSSSIQVWLTKESEVRHLVFSGDIGNLDQPLIKDPIVMREADYVIMESTYGDRNHTQSRYENQKESTLGRSQKLAQIIAETFERGGNVVIPSFAVGRTQELLYLLRNIISEKMLPHIDYLPVFLDSPLAIEATKIFSQNIEGYFDQEAMALVNKGLNPLMFDSLSTLVTADQSRELNFRKESCVIISSSGMCEAGRIKHHLKHNLWRKESTILFCGYQAAGTLGRSIVDGAKKVTIFGEQIEVKASIRQLEGLSGHADQRGLIKWLEGFDLKKPRHVFVVHGDEKISQFFAGYLGSVLNIAAWAPEVGQSFDLLTEKLPIATKEIEFIELSNALKIALDHLEVVLEKFGQIGQRLVKNAKEVLKDYQNPAAKRTADALVRFSEELETIEKKWNSDNS
jgi:metallo-beta-lactamase family protein